MGIKDLNKFITRFTPKAITRKNISTFNGLTLAVDVSIFLYKYKYSNKLIHSFLQQYYHYKQNNSDIHTFQFQIYSYWLHNKNNYYRSYLSLQLIVITISL